MPLGASRRNSTVAGSIALPPPFDRTPANTESAFEAPSGSARRSIVATTSSAVRSWPSWNLTPWRILNVQTEPSALGFQLSARRGRSLSLSSDQVRYSPDWPSTARAPSLLTITGSSAPAGARMPVRIVPPGSGGSVWGGSTFATSSRSTPQAEARKPASETDMPTTVARATNSRRLIVPARYSSMRWFSSSVLRARIASTRC